jgi:MarR family transcriptional regulator, organic hydroperoxide resistance regulator
MVDRLEERSLIERRPDPRDRRVKLIALTPAGEKLRARALEMLYAPPAGFAALSADERATLARLLGKAAAEEPGDC